MKPIPFALALLCLGAVPHPREPRIAAATISSAAFPYIAGSVIAIAPDGMTGAPTLSTVGDATIDGSAVRLGAPGSVTVIASSARALAMHEYRVVPPPDPTRPFIAVASYDDGIVLHDIAPPYTPQGVLGIGGPAAGVALGPDDEIASADTDGETATIAQLKPWRVRTFEGVANADELAFDSANGDLFVTDRDVDGSGALTRITPAGSVTRRILGLTCEGIAVDAERGLVYIANTNDGSVSVVDANTLVELRRFHAIGRVFSLALSSDGSRLYAVSNQSVDSPFGAPGSVALFDVRHGDRRVATSAALRFPLGIALDESEHRVFVTDESRNVVDVLNADTLASAHAPLSTCSTPWQPLVDDGSLYVPCARSNQIDVFNTRTLRRGPGAPFATGGYPLALAVRHA